MTDRETSESACRVCAARNDGGLCYDCKVKRDRKLERECSLPPCKYECEHCKPGCPEYDPEQAKRDGMEAKDEPSCEGTTFAGLPGGRKPCTREPSPGSTYCSLHHPKFTEDDESPSDGCGHISIGCAPCAMVAERTRIVGEIREKVAAMRRFDHSSYRTGKADALDELATYLEGEPAP